MGYGMTPTPAETICPRCGSLDVFVTCVHCDTQSAEELRRSLNLPEPSAHSYKRESITQALVKAVAQRDAFRKVLEEIAFTFPWEDQQGCNVCQFCRESWEHDPGCLWVRIVRLIGLKGDTP